MSVLVLQTSTLPEFCYMSFASQSHGPIEIASVDQLANSNDQDQLLAISRQIPHMNKIRMSYQT